MIGPGTILQAMQHPRLFGPDFADESWDAWRAFLRAVFALGLPDADLVTYRACTGRERPPREAFREVAAICGRRSGKSRIMALIAVWVAAFLDHKPKLARGELATVLIIAASRDQARNVMDYIKGYLSIPALAGLVASETETMVLLSTRVRIEVGTASFRVTRGYSLAACICDEIAYWWGDESARPDKEILRALRPGLMTLGGMLIMASSPYGKSGALYDVWQRYWGQDLARTLVWRAPTTVMNRTIDPAEIARAREEDPESAAAEYDGEWRADIVGFLDRALVESAIERGCVARPPVPGVKYVAFADPSGGGSDAFTAAIAHRDGELLVLDALYERRPPFSPATVVGEVARLIGSYGLSAATGDRYAAGWVTEGFAKCGVRYLHSTRDRSTIYLEALPAFTSGRVRLLDNARLTHQLCSLERRTGAGRDRVDHPRGSHDDCANAAAGALTLALLNAPKQMTAMPLILTNSNPEGIPPEAAAGPRPPAHYLKGPREPWRDYVSIAM